MSENNGKRTQSTIPVTHAAHECGLTQEQFRSLLQPHYKSWETVKRIKFEIYQSILQSLIERAEQLETEGKTKSETVLENSLTAPGTEINSTGESVTEKALTATSDDGEIEVTPETKAVQMQLVSQLPEQALKLNQLSKITAVAFAQENLKDFEEVYTSRLNNGMNKIISNQTTKVMSAIDKLQASDNGEFLGDVGKCQSLTLEDLDAGMNLLLKKIM